MNDKYLVNGVIYSLCELDGISGDVYKAILLSITMLGDDRISDESKGRVSIELIRFITELLSANGDGNGELKKKGVAL